MSWMARLAYKIKSHLDALAARYESQLLRAKIGHVGRDGTLGANLKITGPHKVWLGDNVHIGSGGWIRAEGGLKIGNNTHISRNVVIYTINHDYRGTRLPYDDKMIEKPVTIGENVWIGMNVSIAPGVTIGEGAIIALGACVSSNVGPREIVGNQPLRVIGTRDEIHYEKLKNSQSFGGPDGIKWPSE
jgi:acetyltransferase-like isoleucine patch superfamily enzyme